MKKYSSLHRLFSLTTVLITINSVFGIIPSVNFPNLSQPVQAQESSLDVTEAGMLQYSLGDYHGAVQEFTKVINLEPSNSENYLLRGLSYLFLDNFEKAKEDFSYTIQISPHNATAYSLRGFTSVLLAITEAKEDFKNSVFLLQQQGNFSTAKEIELYIKEMDDAIKSSMKLFRDGI
jgi:Tfp pilus assembly protein PilF